MAEASLREQVEAFEQPWPVGYRAWCRTASVGVVGEGMRGWEEEPWHAEQDALIGRGLNVYVLKARDRHWTTDAILRHLYHLMWVPERSGLYITYSEPEAYQGLGSFKSRMEAVYRALPEWQRVICPVANGVQDAFGTQGEVLIRQDWVRVTPRPTSRLRIATATRNIGATDAYTDVTLDELARYDDPDGTFEAVMPSVRRAGGLYLAGGTLTSDTLPSSRLVMDWQAAREGALPGCAALGIFYGSQRHETLEAYALLEQAARVRGRVGLFELHRQYARNAEEALAGRAGGLLSQDTLDRCYQPRVPLAVPAGFQRWNALG